MSFFNNKNKTMEKDIIKNNIMIAKFMGFKKVRSDDDNPTYYVLPGFNYIKQVETTIEGNWCEILEHQDYIEPDEMLFNSSWDWLMPVIDKIENIVFDECNSYNVTIGSTNYCVIQDSNGDTIEIIKDNGKSKLDTVYRAVIKFIKWYNENEK